MLETISVIIEQSSIYFPLILGSYLSISLMKLPDLSIEAAYVFGAILASKQISIFSNMLPTSFLMITTIISALLGGLMVGFCSSTLTQKAQIPHLLSSIITIGIFYGINIFTLQSPTLSLSEKTNFLKTDYLLGTNSELLSLIIIFLIIFVIAFLFLKTKLAYSFAIFGNNPLFFENYKISTNFVVTSGLLISNSLAGLSGYLTAQTNGFADINMGTGIILFCITALILGKPFIWSKKIISIFVPILGTLSYCTIQQLLLKVGFDLKYFTMVQAILVLIIILITQKQRHDPKNKIDNLGV